MQKKIGLRILNPRVRLLFVIIATSLFAFIKSLELSFGVFICTIIILLLGKRIVYKKVFFWVLLINSIYMILGNWLFSPPGTESVEILLIKINNIGLINGFVGAFKRNAMIILSFAWLSSIDSLYDVYTAINYSERFNKTIIVFLKWIQNLRSDFTLLYYSISLREFELKSKNPIKKVNHLFVVLKAVLNGFFNNIGKMTFNGESHFNNINNEIEKYNGNIEINNLSIKYDLNQKLIIDDINLNITEGQVVLVTGKNQSGKTTLLKAIGGYIPKIEGYINYGGVHVSNKSLNSEIPLKEINQFLRFIVENPADSIIGLNVLQELESQTLDKNKATRISQLLEINHLWDRDVNTLSGGEQARVVLASLLCSDTKVIILESPLGQLDTIGRRAFIDALKKIIRSKKVTIIISDQYAEFYDDIISRVITLENGIIANDVNTSKINNLSKVLSNLGIYYPKLKLFTCKVRNTEIVGKIKNVSISFNTNKVLNSIDLEIYRNQCIALVGNNGSGKSTLALSIAKVLKIDTGEISLYDNKVGIVFQDCSKQILEDTIKDEIILGCKNLLASIKDQDIFFNNMIDWSGLKPNKSTLEISASEIRLLEIVSNIYSKDIIIFDEPTNYLDFKNYIKLHSFIQDLLIQGKTIIIITHDKKFAKLCNRFILMHDSNIVLDTDSFDNIIEMRNQINNA